MSKRKFSDYKQERVSCWSDENECRPEDVTFSCIKNYLFNCNKCSHSFWKSPSAITRPIESWCPFCSKRKICDDTECMQCKVLTFQCVSPEKSLQWSSLNEDSPNQVFSSCNKKYLFNCEKCFHSFSKSPNSITGSRGTWCPFCDNKILCGEPNCTTCYEKTFAFKKPEESLCWSDKNTKKPNEVFAGTGVKYYFDCNKCGHEFYLSPHKIKTSGRWCSYCSNQTLCESDDCTQCREKTFLFHDPEKALCWSPKNKKTPDQVFRATQAKYLFDCDECGDEFEVMLSNVSRRGDWCSKCSPSSKYEEAMKTKLVTLDNVVIDRQQTIYLNKRALYWDFVVNTGTNKFYIETDGSQHFHLKNYMGISRIKDPVKGLNKFRDQRVRDHLKEYYIRKNNKLLFRVSYRQLKEIGTLVDKMIVESESGKTGVVYMDSIYDDWEPIP